jgi:AAA ATPase domain
MLVARWQTLETTTADRSSNLTGADRPAGGARAAPRRGRGRGQGRGQVILLSGEAGIGKTAVAAEAAAGARERGARVLWASCWQCEGAPGYWPWLQVARLLSPAAGALLSGAGEPAVPGRPAEAREPLAPAMEGSPSEQPSPGAARFQLFDELTSALLAEAETRPLVVVLDDLQWADASSVLLLDFLAHRLRAARVLVIGTCRDVELDPEDRVAALLAGVAAAGSVVPLAALNAEEVGEVIAGVLGGEPAPCLVAEVIELARDAGDRELEIEARLLRVSDLLELADPAFRGELAAEIGEPDGTGVRMEQLWEVRLLEEEPATPAAGPAAGTFRRDGALWTLGWAGTSVRMRDAKGLGDLAALLGAPGRQVRRADLAAASGGGEAGRAGLLLGADEVLDQRARRELRERLTGLEEEIDEAERWADPDRAARARQERDALVEELAAATGLGGRSRRLGDQSERARKAVTARIRDVITRIERVHPALGAHLRASVTTGTFCAYSPASPSRGSSAGRGKAEGGPGWSSTNLRRPGRAKAGAASLRRLGAAPRRGDRGPGGAACSRPRRCGARRCRRAGARARARRRARAPRWEAGSRGTGRPDGRPAGADRRRSLRRPPRCGS